tara:strand:+ start:3080 stop:4066 length:987 start_codon:yes stop_codon:yes gene_type:complete
MTYKYLQKNAEKFHCQACSFSCSKESDWTRHISTRKHQNTYKILTNDLQKNAEKDDYGLKSPSGVKKRQKNATALFVCECGKKYQHRQSLNNHRKKCSYQPTQTCENIVYTDVDSNNVGSNDVKELLKVMMKENNQFILSLLPQLSQNITNTNSHNTNHFNIQMFLDKHCKHAMNLTEFIESLPITNETYDHTIENGLTKTITQMITNGLSSMDILERPIHCTDPARKTMYVKDNNVWEKDTNLSLLLNGIKSLSLKQRTMLGKWQEANQGWESKENLQTKMTQLVFNSMTSIEENEKEVNKIIKEIGKNVYLDSEMKKNYLPIDYNK